jgi:hypothetical protein
MLQSMNKPLYSTIIQKSKNLKIHFLLERFSLVTHTVHTQSLHHEGLDIVHTLRMVPQLLTTTDFNIPLQGALRDAHLGDRGRAYS